MPPSLSDALVPLRRLIGPTFLVLVAVLSSACGQDAEAIRAASTPSQPAARTASATPAQPEAPVRTPRFGSAEPRSKAAGAVRLASFNVENLYRESSGTTPAKPSDHLEALAGTIRLLDADIVALQEVESEETLRWFVEGYLADLGYEHIASIDAGDERGIEQSVISRFPIVQATNWPRLPLGGVHPEKWGDEENFNAGQPITFHRSPLKAVVRIQTAADPAAEPYDLTLLVVHKKAGRHGGYWREAEAQRLVELIGDMQRDDPDRRIAVVGDFNALPHDRPVTLYTDRGFIDVFSDRVRGDPAWVTHESGRTIDFILVSPSLVRDLAPGSHFILGTPARPAGVDWRTFPPPVGYASDHYPLVVDLLPGGH